MQSSPERAQHARELRRPYSITSSAKVDNELECDRLLDRQIMILDTVQRHSCVALGAFDAAHRGKGGHRDEGGEEDIAAGS